MLKLERHEAIRERLREALRDLYHNATPRYPSLDEEESERFQSWFDDAAQFEIEYLQDGGAYGNNYRKTLLHEANAGRYKSAAARAYYVNWKMRSMREERARCNRLDSRRDQTNAMWEYATDFGKLYTYGRGGRTLAPERLVSSARGANVREGYFDDSCIAECVEAIRILESFNRYVGAWCDSVPEQWREYVSESLEDNAVRSNN